MHQWRLECLALVLAASASCVSLGSCDNNSGYTGTDKIDFVNRTNIEPLPATAAAGPVGPVGAPVEEVGVLVDGRLAPSGPHVNDAGFTSQEARPDTQSQLEFRRHILSRPAPRSDCLHTRS